ncbi:PadR family transcriptional regulator [Paenibacillus thiaminolyticus]|uniref:PadR family transcriptional regulator n=1 Tax=Paenibacillus thiaminolyticus TaxID=49283 RepID=UPI00232D6CC9|nr:PadR family transcriptional regulator [Paenibacillus thiaminolyticus]WCF07674.1 PadR family transcriptional regulator [Paenibacillus thiaminolyticus]
MAAKHSDTTYAILGLLTTDCHTGYDIKQMMDTSLNHFWKISYGQIYPTLKKLVEDGWAVVTGTAQESKPDKKEYHITLQGMQALQAWLQEPLQQLHTYKNEFLLKLFFHRHQEPDATLGQIERFKSMLQERYQMYEAIENQIMTHCSDEEDLQYWLLTLDYGKRVVRAEMEWSDAAIRQLQQNR